MIVIKNKSEIEIMKKAGKIIKDLLDDVILCKIEEGVSTKEIDSKIEKYITSKGATPILKGYRVGDNIYNFSSCISLNDEVIHGLPSSRVLQKGDMISVDVSVKLNGFHADAARTYVVGPPTKEQESLIKNAIDAFWSGVNSFKVGNRIGDISAGIESAVDSKYSIIRDFCGHGIGRELHEDPQVLNFVDGSLGSRVENGMALAIEPMISAGGYETYIADDGWTVKTRDGSLSAHYENTVVLWDGEAEAITLGGPSV